MGNRKLIYALLIAGMSLATAWAIRGQFGHEQGAAWAGGIGGLSIILLAKRPDWYAKALQATLASAVGWGLGGMISYGIVVGYGRGLEFGNVYYGFAMLFVIGALFGLIGGGLFGLTLASHKNKPVDWPRLITEMAIGGLIFYFFLIVQLGYLMTPPRSEAWAVCFGMAVAMLWYMIRHQYRAPLKVSIWAALGAGFGFAFGNFLQVMGNAFEIPFHFWNVMEYSIGFFGGIGMAYGTFTSAWEPSETEAKRSSLLVPLLLLAVFIPFIVWEQSFGGNKLSRSLASIGYEGDGGTLILSLQWIALLLIVAAAVYLFRRFYGQKQGLLVTITYRDVFSLFAISSGIYTLYSIMITLAFMSTYRIEQYLYVVNYAVIFLLIGKIQPPWEDRELPVRKWTILLVMLLVAIAIMTVIATNSHGEMPGANRRFE
jgi:hypothetical protein